MDVARILRKNREKILTIAARRGAHNVRVFGSVARGDYDNTSDIDFLVEMDKGRTLLDVGGLLMDLRELLGCEVDIVTEKALKKSVRQEVLSEAIPV